MVDTDNELTQISKMRDALNKTGRPIWFMACADSALPYNVTLGNYSGDNAFIFGPGGPECTSHTAGSTCGQRMNSLSNSWLVEYCNMVPRFGLNNSHLCSDGSLLPAGVLSAVDALFTMQLQPYAASHANSGIGPTAHGGGWPDLDVSSHAMRSSSHPGCSFCQQSERRCLDVLKVAAWTAWMCVQIMEVCYPESRGMSWTEQVSHYALWAVLSSVLVLSHDLSSSDARCLQLLTNKEVRVIAFPTAVRC